jgi:hypothetical protein
VNLILFLHRHQFLSHVKREKAALTSKDYKDVSSGKFHGFYDNKSKTIGLMVYRLVDLDYLNPKDNTAYTLFHELRHRMQDIKWNGKFHRDDHSNYGKDYIEKWLEKDADNFAFHWLLKVLDYKKT